MRGDKDEACFDSEEEDGVNMGGLDRELLRYMLMGGGKVNGANKMMISKCNPGETPMNTQMEEEMWKN